MTAATPPFSMTMAEFEDMRRLISETAHTLLTAAEERDLAIRIAAGDQDARHAMICHNFRLVVKIARPYVGQGIPLLDLFQEGVIGLMRAVEKFDHTKGNRFSTYATHWIRQAVVRAIADKSRAIRVPVHMSETISRTKMARERVAQTLGREPTSAEVAAALGVDVERVEIVRATLNQEHTARLSDPLRMRCGADEDEISVESLLAAPDDVAAQVERADLRAQVRALLDTLPDRQRQILTLRYGLDGGDGQTLEQIGARLSLTRERVRQIEAEALGRLRDDAAPLRDAA